MSLTVSTGGSPLNARVEIVADAIELAPDEIVDNHEVGTGLAVVVFDEL